MAKIAVLGNGSWGSVLGSMLADNGNDVVLYGNIDSVNQEINEHHTNTHYMKNWKLNPNVPATGDLEKALDGAEIILFVLPTKAVRIVAKNVRKILDKTGTTPLLVTATKGIEPGSKKLISDIFQILLYHAQLFQKLLHLTSTVDLLSENHHIHQEILHYVSDKKIHPPLFSFYHRSPYIS